MDYFTSEEKTCPCGCGLNLVDSPENMDFLRALNTTRELYGKPMNAESMTRCAKHNREIGGAPQSAHLDGRAVDIECHGTRDRLAMVVALMKAGFKRFELKVTDVHADMKAGAPDMLTFKTERGMV